MIVNESHPLPTPASLEELGEFWDLHDFTGFDNPQAPDVEFQITRAVSDDSAASNTAVQFIQANPFLIWLSKPHWPCKHG
jgi:hypothetical protein